MKTKLLLSIVIFLFGASTVFGQTSVADPAGTSIAENPAAAVNIAKAGGKTFSYTNASWPDWMSPCYTWGHTTTLTGVINGYNTAPPGGACAGMSDLTYNADSSNLAAGIIVYIGTTTYRYLNTSWSWYTNTNVSVRMTITLSDAGGAVPITISGSYLLFAVSDDFDEHVLIEAIGPSASYIGVSDEDKWTAAVDLFDNLHTDPASSICTSFDHGGFYTYTVTAVAGNNGPYCVGEDIELTSSGGTSYSWSTLLGYSSTDQNPTISNSALTDFGLYTVEVTDAAQFGCVDDANTIVLGALDLADPVAVCQNITVQLDASGNVTVSGSDIDGGSTDDCSIVSLVASPSAFTCANVGTNNVTLTVTDGGGNTDDCVAVVTVEDNVNPVAICKDITVYLSNAKSSRSSRGGIGAPPPPGGVTITGSDIDDGSSDACGIASLVANPSSFSCADLGNNNVTLTVTDNNGNTATCIAVVTVVDDVDPTFTKPKDITIYRDASCAYDATVSETGDVTDEADNCGVGEATFLDVVDSSDPCSVVITRTWSLVDNESNSAANQIQTITVEDNTDPSFTVPGDITIYKDASCNYDASVSETGDVLNEADNCGVGEATFSDATDNSDLCAIIITRTWTLIDDCANSTVKTQKITVEDNTPPTFTAPANITIYNSGNCSYDASVSETGDVTNEADNCGVGQASKSDVVDTSDPCSTVITRTWSLTDNCGNAAVDQVQVITIEDDTDPIVVCQDIEIQLDAGGNASIVAADVDDGSSDNCNFVLSVDQTAFSCADIGDNTVTLTATDDCGNTATCTSVVTVLSSISVVSTITDATCPSDCDGSVSFNISGGTPPYRTALEEHKYTFDGAVIDNGSFISGIGFAQNDEIYVPSPNPIPWSNIFRSTIAYERKAKRSFSFKYYNNGDGHNMIGWYGANTANPGSSYSKMVYAMYFSQGAASGIHGLAIYEDGVFRTTTAFPLVASTWYDCRIELKAQGADYYIKDENSAAYTLVYSSNYSTESYLSLAFTYYLLGFANDKTDDWLVEDASITAFDNLCAGNYTYNISNDNGCFVQSTVTVLDIDTEDPTASNPSPISAQCSAPAPDISVVDDEADNCTANPIVAFVSDVSNGNSCPEIITRTYSVTDGSGNSINVVQLITINDDIAPVIAGSITTTTVEGCDASSTPAAVTTVAALEALTGDLTITDACSDDADITVAHSDVSAGTCPLIITRTYKVTDECSNESVDIVHTINIDDTEAPVIAGSITTTTVEGCDASSAPAAVTTVSALEALTGDLTITDVCSDDADITVAHSDVSAGTCPLVITRTYKVTDECSNESVDIIHTIKVNDTEAPVIAGSITATTVEGCDASSAPVAVTTVAALEALTGDLTITDVCSDDADITVAHMDVAAGTCPLVITRTYLVTDECGNESVDFIHTINIDDTEAPAIAGSITATTVEGCDASSVPAAVITVSALEALTGDLTITDVCSADADITVAHSDVSAGTCPLVITRTYKVTDECSNESVDIVHTISIEDNTDPTADPMIPILVQCIGDVPAADVDDVLNEADNCTANPIVAHVSDVPNGNSCPKIILRTYSVTDDCGNSIDLIQIITVMDITAPTFTAPVDVTIYSDASCNYNADVAFTGDVTDEADNCGVGDATFVDAVDNTVPCGIIITRTWSLLDDCGNAAADQIQFITVEDNIAPTFTKPSDITIYKDASCGFDASVGITGDVTDEADNCSVSADATYSDNLTSGVCEGKQVLFRTWSLVDDCGNSAVDQVQLIIIVDDTAPTFTIPANLTIYSDASCNYDASVGVTGDVTDEADNCTTILDAIYVDAVDNTDPCSIIITRTWSLVDNCGNAAADQVQTITVEDNILPTYSAPADLTIYTDVNCVYYASVTATGDVTDEADNCGVGEASFIDVVDNTDPCSIIITRTWSLTDNCGNDAADQVQTITVEDNTLPTFTAPANLTIYSDANCVYDVSVTATGDVTDEADNCGVGEASFVDVVDNSNPCSIIITRTWSLTDNCGNDAADQVQTITVEDNILPAFTAPANITIYSDANCVYDASVTATGDVTDEADNCGVGEATYVDVVDNSNPCLIIITRTWSLADNCGNDAADQIQTITVEDNILPTYTAPADLTIYTDANCVYDASVTATGDVTDEADNCGVGEASFVDVVDYSNPCSIVITRTWSLADSCGNDAADQVQTITVEDNILPTYTTPADLTIYTDANCVYDASVTATGDVTDEADNCGVGEASFVDVVDNSNSCSIIITRTWSLTDNCGNDAADQVQTITVEDNILPTFTAPANLIIYSDANCVYDASATATGDVTDEADNCGVGEASFVDVVDNSDPCSIIITRTWSLTDNCGNDAADQVQTITVEDNILPTADALMPINVQCIGDVPVADIADVQNVADNCTVNPTVVHISDVSDGNTCPQIITRTYSVTDDCMNSINIVQIITIDDDIAPTADALAPINVQCIGDVPAADISDVQNVADNCTVNPIIIIHISDVPDGNTCPLIITRTYSITDDCMNSIDIIQIITVNDDIAPTADALAPIDVQCSGDVPAADIADVQNVADNCTVDPVVTFIGDASDGNTCPELITRTYQITDDCNNTLVLTQTITVDDNILPTYSAPADLTIYTDANCVYDASISVTGDVTDEADNCGVGEASFVDAVDNSNPCSIIITRTWSLTDNCGNDAADQVQTITVEDNILPTADALMPINVKCIGDVPVADITDVQNVADNCTVNPTVVHISDVSDGNTCPQIITRTYSVTDDCMNSINIVQIITIDDDIAPTADALAPVSAQCFGDVPVADILDVQNVADNCTADPTVLHISDVLDGNTCPLIITRTYSVTDDCMNSIDIVQIITVNDDIAPTADALAPIDVQCSGDAPAADIADVQNAADNCTAVPVITYIGDVSDGNTCPEIITRTYHITDDCNNTLVLTQMITVDDDIDPIALCQDISIDLDPVTGLVSIVAADIDNGSSDNCAFTLSASQLDFDCSHVGANTVTLTVTDDCGNFATCDATVTVNDVTAPVITCPADQDLFIGAGCEVILPDYESQLTATDICGIASIVQTPPAGTVYTGPDAGVYTIEFTVTDVNANVSTCTFDVTVIDAEAFTIDDVTYTDVQCFGANDGTITVTTTGGPSGLFYSIDGVDYTNTTGLFTGLTPGTYTVSVMNMNDCMTTWTPDITITEPTLLVIDDVITTNVTGCAGNTNATIEVIASGGTPAYEYSIDNQATWQADPLFIDLAAGDYDIFVRDANGCVTPWGTTIHVNEPAPVMLVDIDVVHVMGCYGDLTGEIHIYGDGGTGTLSYSIDGGANFYDNGGIFTGLPAGFYFIQIMDENGCDYILANPITINQPAMLVVTDVVVTDVTECYGNTDGALDISAMGGTGTILYSIDGGATFVDNGGLFENLAGGNYNVFITDDNGCSGEYAGNPVTIGQPIQVTMTITSGDVSVCAGNNDGFISISAAGGTGVYTYSIDGGANWSSSSDFTGLFAGSYTVMAQDDLGCTQPYAGNPVVIGEPTAIVYDDVTTLDLGCFGAGDGEILVTGSGGTGTLTYSINGGASYQADGNFFGLDAGSYTLMIMDDNGCEVPYANNPVVLSQGNEIVISDVVATDVTCGGTLGSIVITATGGSGSLMYSIRNGADYQTSNVFNNLSADTYIIKVKDGNGCDQLYDGNPVVVEDLSPSNVVINADPGTEVCTGSNVTLTANAFEAVSYTWSTGETGPSIVVSETTPGFYDYTCTVINEDGCESDETISIEFNAGSEITITVDPDQGPYCINDPIVLEAYASDAISYTWEPGGSNDPMIVVTSDVIGIVEYSVTVINSLGCETNATVEIEYDVCGAIPGVESSLLSATIFPNPTDGEFSLELLGVNGEVKISIYDYSGRHIAEEVLHDISTDKYEKHYNLSDYECGVYLLRIENGENIFYKKVVVQ